MDFKPRCLATGIGSVPHTDPDEAVKFVMSYFPDIPYWPQLPAKGSKEGFLNQFIGPLTELGLIRSKGDKYFFDTEQQEWGARLARFYELYMAAVEGDDTALNFFNFPEDSASGFYAFVKYLETNGVHNAKYIKGQISGPLTVGLALPDQDRRAAYYNPQARDVLIKTVALQGLNQVKTLARFGLPVIVFVDDPGLYASGQSTFITLKKDEIVSELNSIYEAIKSEGALTGTHSCAGMDWSILLESKVDIISFDAFEYFISIASYMDGVKSFLNRGGVFAW
ncbi:MAG: uroporphyrinogen decarboxylase/cobalamine-independent methonine synthase family protein, partial [Eubacteriales bacterium]